jgi:nicotinamide-nucleotide amidase
MTDAADRPILVAELLSIGSELTVGETRDTNAGELARSLTELGVRVNRMTAVPDDLETVANAFRDGLLRADLVVSTGGLGPTPDDLTREAIAAATGETPTVDPDLEVWLREIWSRRGMPFPEMNLKQAWLIPSATPLPNPNGTAPGWWIARSDGRVVVALPGPPREMRPMWADHGLPRLVSRSAGSQSAHVTLRLAGIGESQVADLLGEPLLRATDPAVATYARTDAVDVRVSASGTGPDGRVPSERVSATIATVRALLGDHVWAEGETTWPDAIETAMDGRSLSIVEVGTGGSLATLLGDRTWIRLAEALAPDAPAAAAHVAGHGLEVLARNGLAVGGANVGVGVRARERGADTAVSVVVVDGERVHHETRVVFLGGANGRSRAALAAAHILLTTLRRGATD